jgi:hypothetical protein
MSPGSVQASNGFVTHAVHQEGMIIPVDVWIKYGGVFVHGGDRPLEAGDKFPDRCFYLSDPLCSDGYGSHGYSEFEGPGRVGECCLRCCDRHFSAEAGTAFICLESHIHPSASSVYFDLLSSDYALMRISMALVPW